MTKMVRIENADTSDAKITVEVREREHADDVVGRLVRVVHLDHPCAMSTDLFITQSRFLVVREAIKPMAFKTAITGVPGFESGGPA